MADKPKAQPSAASLEKRIKRLEEAIAMGDPLAAAAHLRKG